MSGQGIDLDSILRTGSLRERAPAEAIDLLGNAVDKARDDRRLDVLTHLPVLAETIERKYATEADQSLLDYYIGNAWNGIKCLNGPHPGGGCPKR